MAGRRIVIEFLGKDKSAGSTAANVEKKFGKLGGKLDRVGQAAGKVLAGGTLLAAAGLYKMGQAAAADEQGQVKLAGALRNAANATDGQIAATEKWITAQGKALGVTDDELRPALSKLVNATGDVEKAQRLAALAMNISAGTGKSLESVSAALAKGELGRVDGLAKMGVQTKDATGKTKSFKQITEDLANLHAGKAAAAANTTAGKQKRLQITLAEMGETIGAKVLPAMLKATEVGMKMADWASRHSTLVGALVVGLGSLVAVVYAVSLAMRAWLAVTKVWMAVTKVAAAVQWALNAAMTANPIGLVIVAIAALVAGMVIAYKKSETFRKIVDGAFRGVQKAASFAFNWVKKNWPLILAIITGPIGLATLAVIKNWDRIKSGAAGVVDFVKSIPGRLRDLAGRFGDAGMFLIRAFVNGLSNAGSFVSNIVGHVVDAIRGAINAAIRNIESAISFKIDWPGPGSYSFNPNIPELATGGIVSATPGGRLVRVAEGGHDEAIVPLSGPNAPRMGGSQPIVLQLFTDGRMVEQILVKRERDTGRPLQFRARTT